MEDACIHLSTHAGFRQVTYCRTHVCMHACMHTCTYYLLFFCEVGPNAFVLSFVCLLCAFQDGLNGFLFVFLPLGARCCSLREQRFLHLLIVGFKCLSARGTKSKTPLHTQRRRQVYVRVSYVLPHVRARRGVKDKWLSCYRRGETQETA